MKKQLLCVTRVMLCSPAMLILDEATSAIDARTERLVQGAFERMMRGKTSFVVAHRLPMIQNAHIIPGMDHGRIAEQGTHDKLLASRAFTSGGTKANLRCKRVCRPLGPMPAGARKKRRHRRKSKISVHAGSG